MNNEDIKHIGIGPNGKECKIPQKFLDKIDQRASHGRQAVYFGCNATIYNGKDQKIAIAKGSAIINGGEIIAVCENDNLIASASLVVSIKPGIGVMPKFLVPEDVQNKSDVIDYLCFKKRLALIDDVCKHMLSVKFYRGTSRTITYHGADLEAAINLIKKTDSIGLLPNLIEKKPEWSVVREHWQDLANTKGKNRSGRIMMAAAAIVSKNDEFKHHVLRVDTHIFDLDEYKKSVTMLIEHGVNINYIGSCGNPLALKIKNYQLDKKMQTPGKPQQITHDTYMQLFSFLIESGARTDIKIDRLLGQTVAEYALDSGDSDLIKALKIDQPVKSKNQKCNGQQTKQGVFMPLTYCTLTGVDENTSLQDVAKLSNEFPFAEFGFLYSPKRQGQPGRYPSVETLRQAFFFLPDHVRVALHICGSGVPDLLSGSKNTVRELVELINARSGRIQLNFNLARLTEESALYFSDLVSLLQKYPNTVFITQHNTVNEFLYDALRQFGLANHAILFDASGGRGMSPDAWSPALVGIQCGYAGGLGPDNLGEQLGLIKAAAGDSLYWIDMEGKLRDQNDDFNLDIAYKCLMEAAKEHVVKNQPENDRRMKP